MSNSTSQHLILIEGAATYERILADIRGLETDEVICHIQDFVKIYPDYAPAHNDLAVLFYRAENKLKSLAHYEKAHRLDPSNITYRKNLADFYFVELEWTGDAINTYLDILKDNPFDLEVLNALGTISLKLGRKEQARQYFSRTIQLDSSNLEARLSLQQLPAPATGASDSKQISQLHSHVNEETIPTPISPADSSFQSLFQAVQPVQKLSSEDLYREAIKLVDADRTSEAIPLLETLVIQSPDNALAHNDLGVLCQKSGNLQKARTHHESAVRLQPENILFQKNLADLLCSGFGAFEESLAIYVKLYAENSYDVEIIKAVAHICLEVDKPDDARFFLEKALAIKPWDQESAEALRALKASV